MPCLYSPHLHCPIYPPLHSDLLNDDYTDKISLKCKKNAGIVGVTVETERASGGSLSSKIGTKFSYKGLNFDKAQLKADGGHVLETSLKVHPDVKLAFKGNKGADVCVDYSNGNIFATGILDVKDMSKFSGSGCIGLENDVKVGGEATYGLSGKTGFTSFNAGACYSSGPLFASMTTGNKFSTVNIGLVYKVSPEITLASQTTHSSAKVCDVLAVGGSFKAPIATFKAKVGADGVFNAVAVKEIAPKVTLTGSASMTSSGENFKYGLGISM